MTSVLDSVQKGKLRLPHLVLIYGPDGVGKSTFASEAPNPIFIGTERGTANLDVARLPTPSSYNQLLEYMDALLKEQHGFSTVAVDSLDWLEPLVWEQVCIDHSAKGSKYDSIEDFGYGKGYAYALEYWKRLIGAASKLRDEKGMNLVFIAHAHVRLTKDPQNQADYDRFQLKLNEKAGALWREYVDSVLFANFETTVATKDKKVRAFGDGERFLYTTRRPGFDAKNRFGLPFQIPLSWKGYVDAYEASLTPSADALTDQITELLGLVEDEELKAKVEKSVTDAKGNAQQLKRIADKLRTYAA